MSLLIFFLLSFVLPLILARKSQRCLNILLGWDMLGSAYTGGLPGTTLSGRTGSNVVKGNLRGKVFGPIIDAIMGKRGHCVGAIKGDQLRAQAIIADYGGTP